MAQQSLIKLLSAVGIGSRRQLTAIIKRGGVKVNGLVVESYTHPVDSQKDTVTVNDKPVVLDSEKIIYLMLHKPKGIVSTTEDERGGTTILDILPAKYRSFRLYPVGRLDKDSVGLVLITNDGELTFHLTHPRFQHEKEYLVRIEGILTQEQRQNLERGIVLSDGRTSPAKIKAVNIPPYNYSITIHEGKKRQVRRMFAVIGYPVLELKRVRIGSLQLGPLPEGQVRELNQGEVRALKTKRR
ncbi:MAG TPA: pseudouridine synthase [Dehalococcoidales bacterium]|nr:pseudouridine synthase [Dehalococcoidales bacterium]